jgi:hypothetical protein
VEYFYVFDEYTSGILRSCPSGARNNAPVVYVYAQDGPQIETLRDWLMIAATVLKLLETVALWYYAGWELSVAATACWFYFLIIAVMLRIFGLSREFNNKVPDSQRMDILAGELPTLHDPGQETKIILEVPINVRSHLFWKLSWVVGSIVCFFSTFATYLLLESHNTGTFALWAAFQVVWLVLRYVFYHSAVITDGRAHPVVEQNAKNHQYRLLSLAGGLSRHFAQRHPRSAESYSYDLHDSFAIRTHVRSAICMLDWRRGIIDQIPTIKTQLASLDGQGFVDIELLAVIGDTMLRSISWIHGSRFSVLDLYDSCLVVIRIGRETILTPAARVLSGNAARVKCPEKNQDSEAGAAAFFIPKLGPCRGENNGWVYWIPLSSNRWLYFICGLDSLGHHRAEIITLEEVTRRLMLGNLWVSVKSADELMTFMDLSALLGEVVLSEFLSEKDSET